MKVWEFEEAVREKDGVRIVIRAPASAVVVDYENANAADKGMSATRYIATRITPKIEPYDAILINGTGYIPHGRTKIGKIRETYEAS
jgi:hypothetical protein